MGYPFVGMTYGLFVCLALSGSRSEVHSGVSLMVRTPSGDFQLASTFTETTFVEFSTLSDDIIDAYIATGEPLDKGR